LVIWDLDETFWSGTLSEGDVVVPDGNVQLLRNLTDCGIINSICSKNEFEPTKKRLQELGVWDLFVFPSINWESKGPQLKEKLDKMALRPVNVLFLDDNPSNLGEARHYLPEIQTGGPELIPELIRQAESLEKKDLKHKRLAQYKVLETKDIAAKSFASSEAFLYDSNIQVVVHHDCLNQVSRIHELLLRSNQLNYTKNRISIEELESILSNPDYECGYVTVKDRYGDYGIVGFYAKKGNRLDHFLFSCRTMGQKIEQWVYAQLGFPELEVVGEVRTQLNKTECPGWINQADSPVIADSQQTDGTLSCRILFKGPCDLSHSLVYIKGADQIDTEFTYVSNDEGQIIDAHNHSVHIEGLHTYSDQDKEEIARDCLFVDPSMLSGSFFTKKYDLIVLSTLIESTYQIYRKKGTDLRVVFGGLDLTDPEQWDDYITGRAYTGGNKFTEEYLRSFSEKYECLGLTTPEMYVSFLQNCLNWLPEDTHLCLILGATRLFDGQEDVKARHLRLNQAVKAFSQDHPRIKYIDIDDCVNDPSDFAGEINHFSSRVYYEIAQRIIGVIQSVTGKELKSYSSKMVVVDNLTLKVRKVLKKAISPDSAIYRWFKDVYNKIYKNRG
jgi:FkbH-like protein